MTNRESRREYTKELNKKQASLFLTSVVLAGKSP